MDLSIQNSHATHIISEDVLEREITPDYIRTTKLIVKQGGLINLCSLKYLFVSRKLDHEANPELAE